MKHIAALWESFERDVMPRDAGPIQRRQMRIAFYAGAMALFHYVTRSLDPGADATENDRQFIREIAEELEQVPDGTDGSARGRDGVNIMDSALKRERRYALLQAAATLYASLTRTVDPFTPTLATSPVDMAAAIDAAEALLAEIERREG